MALTKANNRMIDGATVNVLDFGADNTGTTDSTTEIQAAIDSLGTSGGCVYFPAGTYLADTLSINKTTNFNITLLGYSRPHISFTQMEGNTKIKFNGSSAVSMLDVVGTTGDRQGGILVEGLIFDGNDVAAEGIDVDFCDRGLTINRCGFTKITGGTGKSIALNDAYATIIEECYFFDFETGIYIGDACDDVKIVRCYMRGQNAGTIGVEVDSTTTNSDNITIMDSDIAGLYSASDRCIKINGCRQISIRDNYIENTNVASGSMIEIIDADVTVIEGNYYNVTSSFSTHLVDVSTTGTAVIFNNNRVANMSASTNVINGCANLDLYRSVFFGNDLGSHTTNIVDDETRFSIFSKHKASSAELIINGYHKFDGNFFYNTRQLVSAKTADYAVQVEDSNKVFTNSGATGAVNFTLPAAQAGLTYTFVKYANQNVSVTPAAGDEINDGGAATAISNTASETMKRIDCVAVDGTHWVAIYTGTWA